MNPEYGETPRTWAAQAIALILLSMAKPDAILALAKMEEIIPGMKKFVSKFIRSHSNLLTIFPPQGLPPLDAHNRVDGDTYMGDALEKDEIKAGPCIQAAPEKVTGVKTDLYTPEGSQQPVADEGDPEGRPLRDAVEEFEKIVEAEALEATILESKKAIDSKRFSMRMRNAQLTLQV